MSESHLYFYVQDLGLTTAQRATVVQQLAALQANPNDPQLCRRNHWRVNLAGDAVLFETALDTTHLTPASIKARLVALFGVAANTVTYATTQSVYGPYVTYSHNGTPKLRLGIFSGPDASWRESWEAATAYVAADAAAWAPVVTP